MIKRAVAGTVLAMMCGLFYFTLTAAAEKSLDERRQAAAKLQTDGNFRDAYDAYRRLSLDADNSGANAGNDMLQALNCLRRLARISETDSYREEVIKVHSGNWRLLQAAAHSYLYDQHYGMIVAGKFERGGRRGGGKPVSSIERDRVRGLQLMEQARGLIGKEADKSAVGQFYLEYANIVFQSQGGSQAWKLQTLTDLKTLPDYEEGGAYYGYRGRGGFYGGPGYGGGQTGAPVDAEGKPVQHHVPASFEAAKTDGERWRWLLEKAVEANPKLRGQVLFQRAIFLQSQFGVGTMGGYFGHGGATEEDDDVRKDESGPYAVQTLKDNETIARLANGIKRFELPDEFHHLALFKEIASLNGDAYQANGADSLATVYENRRQYPKAADAWRKAIAKHGPGPREYPSRQRRLDQIINPWGQFENATVQPAKMGATVNFRFRNGKKVDFEAHEIKFEQLLADVKAYIRTKPQRLDWQQMDFGNLGYRLVTKNESKYLGKKVANWSLDLKPRPNHFDERTTITTPLQKGGAYLLVGKMADGNISRIIVWVTDTVIVQKQLDGKAWYFVADALTGKPIEKANVEFFGYQQKYIRGNQYQIEVANFAEFTDKNGQVIPSPQRLVTNYQWVITARTDDGRFAHLGFTNVWYGRQYDAAYNQVKVFLSTDRPVYRPKQAVKFKMWVRNPRYDEAGSSFAKQEFKVRITDPRGQKVDEKTYTTDEFGGLNGEVELKSDAVLGQYFISIVDNPKVHGGGHFRVEEYKKPEFEVTVDSPSEPVMLGEKITATIKAKYYFGAPVTNAKVHYKVERKQHDSHWYPIGLWDWYYGSGYWWFAYDYVWYPGWHQWGCFRPIPPWWPRPFAPPEVVLDREVSIGPDGIVKVEIDTAVAKAAHPDQDHEYSITAEVVDESRRTIVGTGSTLVARKPFKVFSWVNRGHYRVGDTIHASFKAQTLDKKPVSGKGVLQLLKITYDKNMQPIETEAQKWNIDTDAQGEAKQTIKASEAGQYRLSYKVTDSKKHTIEGGYVFTIVGEGFNGSLFRFNDIEIVTDKREYKPGDKIRLQVNTNRVGSTVVLFVRAANGVYPQPIFLHLAGKSTIHEIDVVQRDMPNMFIEALTISNGKLHQETREVIVPPEKRIINVKLQPSATEYRPGTPAKVQLKLTDLLGKPFVGSTVLTIYDKSVEYVSGGSNVSEIREFFWKWRRHHHPSSVSNLTQVFYNLLKQGEIPMSQLGVFGNLILAESKSDMAMEGAMPMAAPAMAKGGMGGMAFGRAAAAPGAPNLFRRNRGADRDGASAERQLAANGLQQDKRKSLGEGSEGSQGVEPTVRKNFADTAFWAAAITTDKEGLAEVSLTMPESLTTWKIRAWSMGHGTRVGQSDADVITSKKLIVRLQSPRFFVEKDEVVLSANVHNYLAQAKKARVILELEGRTISPIGSLTQTVDIPAGGEKRVDWRVKVTGNGNATIRMKAITDEESDAMEMTFPVYVHGMLKTESFTGVIRPKQHSASVELKVPAERRINETELEVRYSPTLAGAMVDALPYLVSFEYKTTDTTLTRFLPTVITQNILKRMGLDLKEIRDKRNNLNAQELGDPKVRAKQWKRFDSNPVFDQAEVDRMVGDGVKALTEMQLSDGGWGWFYGWGEHSSAHTTSLVVHGFQVAKENGVALVPGVLERGVTWLTNYQNEQVRKLKNYDAWVAANKGKKGNDRIPFCTDCKSQADNLDALVYMVLVDADVVNDSMQSYLYRDRTKLSVYAMAMYGLALHKQKDADRLAMILRNIDQYLVQDDENQTAYLKLPEGYFWWYWHGNEVEANTFYLKLLSRTDPKGEKASRLVKYLLNNRKHATYWSSTRDTAFAIEALAEYMKVSGEDKPNLTIEVWLDGKKQKEVKVDSKNLFTFDNKFVLRGDAVESGPHTLELRKKGTGPLYFNAYLTNFTLEDFITRAGLEIKVNRKFYKLVRDDKQVKVAGSRGQALDQRVEKYRREELKNRATLKSGDLIEIELEIDSKNDYEYLVFSDMKAAGFEAVNLKSGYDGNSLGAYIEFRDEKATFFVRSLPRGKHSISYRLKAEIPGKFSALPAKGLGMYAPELVGNSDEMKISITD